MQPNYYQQNPYDGQYYTQPPAQSQPNSMPAPTMEFLDFATATSPYPNTSQVYPSNTPAPYPNQYPNSGYTSTNPYPPAQPGYNTTPAYHPSPSPVDYLGSQQPFASSSYGQLPSLHALPATNPGYSTTPHVQQPPVDYSQIHNPSPLANSGGYIHGPFASLPPAQPAQNSYTAAPAPNPYVAPSPAESSNPYGAPLPTNPYAAPTEVNQGYQTVPSSYPAITVAPDPNIATLQMSLAPAPSPPRRPSGPPGLPARPPLVPPLVPRAESPLMPPPNLQPQIPSPRLDGSLEFDMFLDCFGDSVVPPQQPGGGPAPPVPRRNYHVVAPVLEKTRMLPSHLFYLTCVSTWNNPQSQFSSTKNIR